MVAVLARVHLFLAVPLSTGRGLAGSFTGQRGRVLSDSVSLSLTLGRLSCLPVNDLVMVVCNGGLQASIPTTMDAISGSFRGKSREKKESFRYEDEED